MPKWAKCGECGGEVVFDAWAHLNEEVYSTFDNNTCTECRCNDVDFTEEEIEEEAAEPNDTLTAASPDLLAALIECRDCLVAIWDSNTLGPTSRQLLTAATAAIDKAVGKTNEKAPNP